MKKTVLFLSLLAAGALALPASAQNHDGGFINGNIGRSDVDRGAYDDTDTAWGLNTGYRWAVSPSTLFGVELGYTDLGKFKSDSLSVLGDAELKGWTAGVNTHIDITPEWYFAARGGYFRSDIRSGTFLATADMPAMRIDGTSSKYYLGAGFGYNVSDNSSIGLHYDRYEARRDNFKLNPDVWSLRMEYRF